MLRNLRNNLRMYWLTFLRGYKNAVSTCWKCGRYGAAVCSLVYPKRLCERCATAVCRRAGK